MKLELEAVARADGRFALFMGDHMIGHLASDKLPAVSSNGTAGAAETVKTTRRKAPARRPPAKRAASKATAPAAKGHSRRTDPAKMRRAAQLYQGGETSLVKLAKATGIKYQTLYGAQKRGVLDQDITAPGEETGVMRRCQECPAKTTRSICPNGHRMPGVAA